MSSNKLDQSLDQIMTDARKTGPRRGARRVNAAAGKVTGGPVGGIKKNVKAAKVQNKVAAPAAPTGEGKIIINNLPPDVAEQQIKDYFTTTIGPIKKVLLTYGKNGVSRGNATVIFGKYESAVRAAKELDGIKVDNRPMKIELVMGAQHAPIPAPLKTLGDRISKPKNAVKEKSKPVAAPKAATRASAAGRGGRGARRGRNPGRGKPKTSDELDAEMQDYFGGDNGDANGGAVQPVAHGEAATEDEIM